MKITKSQLKQIIKEEIERVMEAAPGGDDIMQAIADVPKASQDLAKDMRAQIEALTDNSPLGPEAIASIVAELIQADY
tara:strand:- start:911 stop:1144 length:234 start_codon:yes stop_codon:yes gene_type:complete